MKIMHLLPALSSGGVEQVVLELCRGITAAGEQCCVVSAGGPMTAQVEETGARHLTHGIGKKSPVTLLRVLRLARVLCREKPDILHMHSRLPAWVGYLACGMIPRAARPVLLTTFHGFYSVNAYSAVMTKGRRIIAVSQCIRDYILASYPGVQAERICVIPNSFDPAEYNPNFRPTTEWLETWHREHPELDGRYVLCLPGRITRGKGVHHIVPILTALRQSGIPAHFIIPGEVKKGKEAFRNEVMQDLAQAGLSENVTWLGLRRDLREIFCVSDAVLSLSIQPEAGSKVILEALAMGCPTAGYAHGAVHEELTQYMPAGSVPVGDTAAMAERLAAWYRARPEPPLPVGSPYTQRDMFASHLSLYRSLIDSRQQDL